MRGWITNKLVEYLGKADDVQDLIDFITSKIAAHASAQELMGHISHVFDDDGVFVVKLWRKLIFEILCSTKK
jgi:hypothetical protein